MYKIIRWYNQNRKKVWKMIGIFMLVIIVIQMADKITEQNQNNTLNNISNIQEETVNLDQITINDNKSVITGDTLSNTQKNVIEVIDDFVAYCNNKQINEAYNLLSEDCQKEMYPTVAIFQENYYNNVFKGTIKNISAENWVGNIYKIKFMEDALSTGIYNAENGIQDYITGVENEENEIKLNINSYIGKEEINSQNEDNDVEIKVLEKHQYIDFETYVFEVKNNTDNTILLNDLNNEDTMYLEDQNNIKYTAYMHELSEGELKVFSKQTKRLTVKFYNRYGSRKKIENVTFLKIILNYSAYSNFNNIGYYRDYGTIQINL